MIFCIDRQFLRFGFAPWCIKICHRKQAVFSTRRFGWRIGNWYVSLPFLFPSAHK
jgi:hypothetical protein